MKAKILDDMRYHAGRIDDLSPLPEGYDWYIRPMRDNGWAIHGLVLNILTDLFTSSWSANKRYVAGIALLEYLPGSTSKLWSYQTQVMPKYRGRGLGSALMRAKINLMGAAGGGELFATVADDNIPQLRLLRKFNWQVFPRRVGWLAYRDVAPMERLT